MIISLYLDGLFSIIPYVTPLFTLTYIVFKANYDKRDIFKWCFIIGILYDVAYTNTLILNTVFFILISFYIQEKKEMGLLKLLIYLLAIITIYMTFTFLILYLYNYISFDISIFKIYLGALITNGIYLFIIYYLKHIINW